MSWNSLLRRFVLPTRVSSMGFLRSRSVVLPKAGPHAQWGSGNQGADILWQKQQRCATSVHQDYAQNVRFTALVRPHQEAVCLDDGTQRCVQPDTEGTETEQQAMAVETATHAADAQTHRCNVTKTQPQRQSRR